MVRPGVVSQEAVKPSSEKCSLDEFVAAFWAVFVDVNDSVEVIPARKKIFQ